MPYLCLSAPARSLARKLKAARKSSVSARATFHDLDGGVADTQRQQWLVEEQRALQSRLGDPSAMDIFEVRLDKGMPED